MTTFQNNLTDVFQHITLLWEDLSFSTKEKSQSRYDVTRSASQHMMSYLYHKSKYVQELNSINTRLAVYENQLYQGLGSKLSASDESIKIMSNSVGNIQKLLLEIFPPESEEWKFLAKTFPTLMNYRPN